MSNFTGKILKVTNDNGAEFECSQISDLWHTTTYLRDLGQHDMAEQVLNVWHQAHAMQETLLREQAAAPAWNPESHWDEHSIYPRSDWQAEVANGDTCQSYIDWANSQANCDSCADDIDIDCHDCEQYQYAREQQA